MPTPEESWRLTEAARARRRAEHPCPDEPRIKVRLPHDPLAKSSLYALAVGVALILLGIALAPPA